MIGQWRSMMDNLSDVCYLVQLIARQIFIYLRDIILYKFFWLATSSDDFDSSDSKFRGFASRNITADIIAFSVVCIILFLLVIVASKCEKDERGVYSSTDAETASAELQEDPYCISSASSSSTNYFHGCGDSIRGRITKRNLSDEDLTRLRTSDRKRTSNIPKKSIFGLNSAAQPLSSQSTQTKKCHKMIQKWLIRRTRSGQIYGKYPV